MSLLYKNKYVKYKNKYLKLKQKINQHGGVTTYSIDEIINTFSYDEFGDNIPEDEIRFTSFTQLNSGNLLLYNDYLGMFYNIDLYGKIINELKYSHTEDTDYEEYNHYHGLIVLNNGNLAICNNNHNRIEIFDINGNFIRKIDSYLYEGVENRFNKPMSVIQLNNGNLAVSDVKNTSEIIILDINGNFISKFPIITPDRQKGIPYSITQLHDDIIVVNNGKNILFFNMNGEFQNVLDINGIPSIKKIIQLNNGNLCVMYKIISTDKFGFIIIDLSGNIIIQFNNENFIEINDIKILNDNRIGLCCKKKIIILKETQLEIVEDAVRINYIITKLNTLYNIDNIEQGKTIRLYYLEKENVKLFTFKIKSEFYDEYNNLLETIDDKFDLLDKLYEEQQNIFEQNKLPFFIFINKLTNKQDNGIDGGGLTKFVFYQLSLYFTKETNNKYFEQDSETKLYRLKPYTGNDKEHYYKIRFIGKLFGLAIKLRQIIEIELDPFLLLYLLYDNLDDEYTNLTEYQILFSIQNFNPDLLNQYPYICYDQQKYKSKESCKYNLDSEEIILSDNEDDNIIKIKEETTKKINDYYKENRKLIIELLIGFRASMDNIIDLFRYNKLQIFNQFICGSNNTDYDTLIKNIQFIEFENEDHINSLKDLIKKNVENNSKDYIKTFLIAITGANKIPIGGYPQQKPLQIKLDRYLFSPISVHTCFNTLEIKTEIFMNYYESSDKETTDLYNLLLLDNLKIISNDFSRA